MVDVRRIQAVDVGDLEQSKLIVDI